MKKILCNQPLLDVSQAQVGSYWDEVAKGPLYTNWLTEQCSVFIESQGLEFEPYELASSIFDILKSPKNDSDIQGSLFEILGVS